MLKQVRKNYNFKPIAFNIYAMGLLVFILIFTACKKGDLLPNLPPDTHISIDTIAVSGKNRLPTEVKLSWYGTDKDGYVTGFEISFDQMTWFYTKKQDSTFKFDIKAGIDTADIQFYVRAIDNDGLADPEPDHLIVPIRNTAPIASFDEKSFPEDSTRLVTTFRWSYWDADGNETVKQAFLKANNGAWTEIDRSKIIISLVPENNQTAGPGDALIYYDNIPDAASTKLPGVNNNGDNVFYLKVLDQSGAESNIDTSAKIFISKRSSDLLVIGCQPDNVNAKYLNILKSTYPKGFDYIDYYVNVGIHQPKFWSPTFTLLLQQYPKVFINSDQSAFTHKTTGITLTLLEFMAPSFQRYNNEGGKSFITTSFQNKKDVSILKGPFPIDTLSQANGQAVISKDSVIFSNNSGYPSLSPTNFILGSDPHHFSPDAESFYKANVTAIGGWTGPKTVGSRRLVNGKIVQVLFTVELYLFDQKLAELNKLFDIILNTDLN